MKPNCNIVEIKAKTEDSSEEDECLISKVHERWCSCCFNNIRLRKSVRLNCIMTNVMHKFLIYLSIYLCLTCFGLSFSPSSEAGVQFRQWFNSPGYGVSTRTLTPYPVDLNHCRNCTPASEDERKGRPKQVRQK
jgi:hypothetical protein